MGERADLLAAERHALLPSYDPERGYSPDEGALAALAALRYHFTIQPVRTRTPDPRMGCDVARVVGYRFVCTCGERGGARATVMGARVEALAHRDEAHPR